MVMQTILESLQGSAMWQCPACRYQVFDIKDDLCHSCKASADYRDRYKGQVNACGVEL